ncbi:hypothetical protein MIMGU_mgv1a019804mg, partial [Erythranthe guttata]
MIQFKIGLCQLSVTPEKAINVDNARRSIQFASKRGAALVVLPIFLLLQALRTVNSYSWKEMWNCPYSTDYFERFAEKFDEKDSTASSLKMLSEVACEERITIVGGSIPEWSSGGKLYNTCFVFGPNGDLLAKHRKMHLFDINAPGDISFNESDTFSAGSSPTIVDTHVGRIGIGICHDIRFPELAMLYRARGAHLICYPGAFNMSTGEALWELEQRARH